MPPVAATASVSPGLQEELLHLLLYLGSGWILYLLLGLSVLSAAVAMERLLHFWQRRDDVTTLQRDLDAALKAGRLDDARALLQARRSHPAQVVLQGLEALDRGPAAVEEVIAGASQVARLDMERGIAFLGTLGNNAPFIGLFGTVLGIIRAFRDLSANTLTGSSAVMAGIAEALVATAVGLMVALPAVAVFNLLQRRVRTQLSAIDAVAHTLLAHAKTRRGG